MQVAVSVEGRPVPQGSMVASYNRKLRVAHVHHVQGEALAMWRGLIRVAMRAEGAMPTTQPVRLSIQFGMPRPKYHYRLSGGRRVVKMQHLYDRPAVAPDLDKLVRAVADALTGICYNDDSQIVEVLASKVYADKTYIEVSDAVTSPQQEVFGPSVGLGSKATESTDP